MPVEKRLSALHFLLSAIRHPPSVLVPRSPFLHSLSVTRRSPSALHSPPFLRPPSSVSHPPSSAIRPPSVIFPRSSFVLFPSPFICPLCCRLPTFFWRLSPTSLKGSAPGWVSFCTEHCADIPCRIMSLRRQTMSEIGCRSLPVRVGLPEMTVVSASG